jgi:cell shape-determining protein MreC
MGRTAFDILKSNLNLRDDIQAADPVLNQLIDMIKNKMITDKGAQSGNNQGQDSMNDGGQQVQGNLQSNQESAMDDEMMTE